MIPSVHPTIGNSPAASNLMTVTYAAFLRGINVRGRIIRQGDLVDALVACSGLSNVIAVLQSGNLVFTANTPASELAEAVQGALKSRTGHEIVTFVQPLDEVAALIAAFPWAPKVDTHDYLVFFEPGLASRIVGELSGLGVGPDRVQAAGSAVYWQVPKGQTLKSPFGLLLTRSPYHTGHTNRNLNTLTKVVQKGRSL